MESRNFYFDLPEELIAQEPSEKREESRLLLLNKNSGQIQHSMARDFINLIPPGSLLVFNQSRVRKARLYASSESGGKVEILFLKQSESLFWKVMTSKAKKQRVGKRLKLPENIEAYVTEDLGDSKIIRLSKELDEDYFQRVGHVPLPPYIKREDRFSDENRYQTVYSRDVGSVAAPTAGLHFTETMMQELKEKFQTAFITLHVGPGTFLPVRTANIEDHVMHEEDYEISAETANLVNKAMLENRNIIAVGTTTVRTLESAFSNGLVRAGRRSTDLFIYPGFHFSVVKQMFTNFHTPDSSLVIMVSAFAGREKILNAYNEAIQQRYRFFSYGDAMFIC